MKRSAWALGFSILAFGGNAAAAPKTQADTLFEEGKVLYDAGKFEESCAKLAESQRIDPSVGTLGLLSACEEKRGRLALAYRDFVETARLAQAAKDPREKYANERAEALKPRVPRLVIRVDPAIASPRVTRNGEPVAAEQLGAELLVDPGEIEIVGTGAGKGEFRQKVLASPSSRIEVMVRLSAPGDAGPEVPVGPTEHPTARALAYVAGGLGLVGIGLGSYFGAQAISKNNESKSCAPTMMTCDARDQAFTSATISTVTFGVGVAALGAATALFLVSRPEPPPKGGVSLHVTPTLGGAALLGSF